jgi:hypothetical protein
VMAGSIYHAYPAQFMQPFFTDLHKACLENGLKNINVDIKNLDFINSSAIKEIINWIISIEEVPEEQMYTITFICESDKKWQSFRLDILIAMNDKIVKVL